MTTQLTNTFNSLLKGLYSNGLFQELATLKTVTSSILKIAFRGDVRDYLIDIFKIFHNLYGLSLDQRVGRAIFPGLKTMGGEVLRDFRKLEGRTKKDVLREMSDWLGAYISFVEDALSYESDDDRIKRGERFVSQIRTIKLSLDTLLKAARPYKDIFNKFRIELNEFPSVFLESLMLLDEQVKEDKKIRQAIIDKYETVNDIVNDFLLKMSNKSESELFNYLPNEYNKFQRKVFQLIREDEEFYKLMAPYLIDNLTLEQKKELAKSVRQKVKGYEFYRSQLEALIRNKDRKLNNLTDLIIRAKSWNILRQRDGFLYYTIPNKYIEEAQAILNKELKSETPIKKTESQLRFRVLHAADVPPPSHPFGVEEIKKWMDLWDHTIESADIYASKEVADNIKKEKEEIERRLERGEISRTLIDDAYKGYSSALRRTYDALIGGVDGFEMTIEEYNNTIKAINELEQEGSKLEKEYEMSLSEEQQKVAYANWCTSIFKKLKDIIEELVKVVQLENVTQHKKSEANETMIYSLFQNALLI